MRAYVRTRTRRRDGSQEGDGEEEGGGEEEEGGWVIIRSPTSNSSNSRHNSLVALFVSSAHAKSHGSYKGGFHK